MAWRCEKERARGDTQGRTSSFAALVAPSNPRSQRPLSSSLEKEDPGNEVGLNAGFAGYRTNHYSKKIFVLGIKVFDPHIQEKKDLAF